MATENSPSLQINNGKQFLARFELPKTAELDNNASCLICQEPFFTGEKPETPIKLPCGHLFGFSCILTWASKPGTAKTCPLCRKDVLTGMTAEEPNAQLDEASSLSYWNEAFLSQDVRQPMASEALTDEERIWAEKAEELWMGFCEVLVQSLDRVNTAEDWICFEGAWVREVVSLATVERFSAERLNPGSRMLDHHYLRNHMTSYHALCTHLNNFVGEYPFLTPGAAFFTWLAELHQKISDSYDHLERRIRPASRLETRELLANQWTGI